jgi:hypothetical protein
MLNMREFRKEVQGKIFSVVFRKKNGELRTMQARLGVKKGITGEGLKYDAEARNNLIVYDMQKQAYRTVKFDSVLYLNYNNKKIATSKAFFEELN